MVNTDVTWNASWTYEQIVYKICIARHYYRTWSVSDVCLSCQSLMISSRRNFICISNFLGLHSKMCYYRTNDKESSNLVNSKSFSTVWVYTHTYTWWVGTFCFLRWWLTEIWLPHYIFRYLLTKMNWIY